MCGEHEHEVPLQQIRGSEDETAQHEKLDAASIEPPKLQLSWEEKQQLLFQIYDEGEIPAELLKDSSALDVSDVSEMTR